jgi:hypothetical protein
MELSEMQRLKQLEDEHRRLKHIVAEQTLDIQALKVVVAKCGKPIVRREAVGWLRGRYTMAKIVPLAFTAAFAA